MKAPLHAAIFPVLFSTCLAAAESRIVKSPAELKAALANLEEGGVIKIAPGEYGSGHYVRNLSGVTVEALDPSAPPVFTGGGEAWHFTRCEGLTLRNLTITGQSANGINIDDGGRLDLPVKGITLEGLKISDIGPQGNHDGIKLSGLRDFTLRNCSIEGWAGEGIDLVGCHASLITGCVLTGKAGFAQTTGVQVKGGSSGITIEKCRFIHTGARPLNIGGSTGLAFFRPQGAKYEARDITVKDCLVDGGVCAVAFVGVDGAAFTANTILYPEKWILRILQETRVDGFIPCRNVVISGNRIVFRRSQVAVDVNIGSGTNPGSFVFEGNRWFAEDAPAKSKPKLPSEEKQGGYGIDPLNPGR